MLDEEIHIATVKAMEELKNVSMHEIEKQTAITWLGRAIASYSYYATTGSLKYLLEAEGYAQEAIEHAALADPSVYQTVLFHIATAKYNFRSSATKNAP